MKNHDLIVQLKDFLFEVNNDTNMKLVAFNNASVNGVNM